jgi:hypothetical protein
MVRKRPCRICRKWFEPHPRAGDRQHTCSHPSCQQERHRRACADWRRRNPDLDREGRLRQKLASGGTAGNTPDTPRGLNRDAVRDAVGLEVAVILDELVRLLQLWTRDAVRRKVLATKGQFAGEIASCPRDAMACTRVPP